jgi:cytoplasmic iron level regulating protein YaaA (DUF328/UPF0246 family)
MNFQDPSKCNKSSQISKTKEMRSTLKTLEELSIEDIIKTMKVSQKIAELNYTRFQNFKSLPEKQALYAYNGDVYNNIDTDTLDEKAIDFSQKHLRILSALYGLLKPLDMIKAYRLEMSSKLKTIAPKGMNIYWKEQISKKINSELRTHTNKFLINIASNEYSASIDDKLLGEKLINIHFREVRNDKLANIALNSKRTRGMLADYIIRNEIDHPENIKSFNKSGYIFDAELSNSTNFYFVKQSVAKN